MDRWGHGGSLSSISISSDSLINEADCVGGDVGEAEVQEAGEVGDWEPVTICSSAEDERGGR